MATEFSPAALAYLGDAVLELMVRRRLVCSGVSNAGKLNDLSRSYVSAVAQSDAVERILPILTENELDRYKAGRNMHSAVPKSAGVGQYRRATGMEALFAYLYLKGEDARMQELFDIAFEPQNNDLGGKEENKK